MKKFISISKSSPLARVVAGGTRRGVAKKFIIAITLLLSAFGVRAENETQIATSVGYVAEELETRQDKFQKLGADKAMTYSGTTDGAVSPRTITATLGAETNTSDTQIPTVGGVNTKLANQQDELNLPADTVLVNTGVAGAPAAKGIYDDSGSYAAQQDSLIDAATFNAALQNAINSELSCAVRKIPGDDTSPCYLFDVGAPTTNLIIPDTYTRLEYLESTGTQYIDTGRKLRGNDTIEFKYSHFTRNASDNMIVGAYEGDNSIAFNFMGSANSIGLYLYYGSPVGTWLQSISNLNQAHTIRFSNGITYIDNIIKKRTTVDTNLVTSKNGCIFSGGGGTYKTSARVYYYKVWDSNGNMIQDFIPARRNSDGVLGMYDTVTNTFYINAGMGTFIAGPELSSNIYLPMD